MCWHEHWYLLLRYSIAYPSLFGNMLFWWICKIIWRGLLVCWAFGEMSLRWLKLIVCFRRLVVLRQSNSFLQSRQKDIPRQDYTKKSVEISGISYKGKRNLVKAEGDGYGLKLAKIVSKATIRTKAMKANKRYRIKITFVNTKNKECLITHQYEINP